MTMQWNVLEKFGKIEKTNNIARYQRKIQYT